MVQSAVLTNTWPVYDKYRQSFLMGELLWNFQDFESYESRPSSKHIHCLPCNLEQARYSGTSDKGPSEIGTTSLQRTLVAAPC